MRRLLHPDYDLSCGWVYTCPATGFEIVGESLLDLISKTALHLKANDMPVPNDLRKIVENSLAERSPKELSVEIR